MPTGGSTSGTQRPPLSINGRVEPLETSRWPVEIYDQFANNEGVSLDVLELLLKSSQWIHSVIQSIDYADDKTIRHCFSVDFTVPESAPLARILDAPSLRVVPIATVPKAPMSFFSIEDAHKRTVAHLPAKHARVLASTSVVVFAERQLERDLPDHIVDRIAEIIEDPLTTQAIVNDEPPRMKAWLHDRPLAWPFSRDKDPTKRRAVDEVLREFASNDILAVAIPQLPGERVTLTYTYQVPFRFLSGVPWWLKIRIQLGWAPYPQTQRAAAAATVTSYQLRLSAPPGVDILYAKLYERSAEARPPIHFVGGPRSQIELASGLVSGLVQADFPLEAQRSGWNRTLKFVALATTALLAIGAIRLPTVLKQLTDMHTRTDAIAVLATLMFGTVGLIATVLARSGEHPLLSSLLSLRRSLAAGLALLPLIAGSALILFLPQTTLRWTWGTLAVIALLLTVAFSVPFRPPKPTPDTRAPRATMVEHEPR